MGEVSQDMELLPAFKDFLFSQKNPPSGLTVKNYLADVRRFIRWYEDRFSTEFLPTEITPQVLKEYKKSQLQVGNRLNNTNPAAMRSVERYFSTLRKFFSFLEATQVISTNPFDLLAEAEKKKPEADPWNLFAFKEHLYVSNASALTIKNYLLDLNQFIAWLVTVTKDEGQYEVKKKEILSKITPEVLEEYKRRLLLEAGASPNTVNRKLSSLRRYITWATTQGMITHLKSDSLPMNVHDRSEKKEDNPPIEIAPVSNPIEEADATSDEINEVIHLPAQKEKAYSPFPPVRMLQRLGKAGIFVFDLAVVLPVLRGLDSVTYFVWKAKGSPVFVTQNPVSIGSKIAGVLAGWGLLQQVTPKKAALVGNLPKTFYAPLAMSMQSAPLHRKALHHLRYSRPGWYRRYHSYKIIHYIHAAILILCMTAAGFGVAQAMVEAGQKQVAFASLPDGPPRVLSFKGRLSRIDSSPITANTALRFSIYNDPISSGSAMLWEEVQNITPDGNGNFTALLGRTRTIPQRLFKENARLYIGMTVGTDPEMQPRRQIPTEVFSATSETVQGLRPITDPNAGQKNTILALDSSGNLSIGGNANPIFMATGGSFTLAGQTLLLTTTPGTNTDIILSPDGLGKIDLQRPIHNASNYTTASGIVGAVEIADSLAITATESSQSALLINQNSSGALISASSSGIAKFSVSNTGAAMFADSVTIEGGALQTTQTSFSLLTTNPINLVFGTSASSLAIGSTDGETIIRNAYTTLSGNLNVNGKLGATFGNSDAGITFSGSGDHLISATSGSLKLGNVTMKGNVSLEQNSSIVPTGTEGVNNLGSQTNPFDSLYVTSIISPSILWQTNNGVISPGTLSSDIAVGGTASSSAVWQVFASGATSGTASSSGHLSFRNTDTKINQLNGGSLTFQTSPGGDAGLTPQVTLQNNGNVGLGIMTPGYRLDLPNNADATGQARANAWVTYSSRRFKEEITPISDPLMKIARLQGVYYNWKPEYGGSRDIGFIAEEVGQVLPELVEWEKDGVNAKSLKYDRLTALTIEGIKAQQEQIQGLQRMVHAITLSENKTYHITGEHLPEYRVFSDDGGEVLLTGAFRNAYIGTMRVGKQFASAIQTQSVLATEGILDRLESREIASRYIETKDIHVTESLTADKAVILSLRSDELQSANTSSTLLLTLGSAEVGFYKTVGGARTQVANITHDGNAFFAGTVEAEHLSATQSIAAKKVIADELELTDEGWQKLTARLNLPTTEPYQAKESRDESGSIANGTPPVASKSAQLVLSAAEIITDYEDFASASAHLNMLPTQTPYTDGVTESIPSGSGMVIADLSVADMITINGNMILTHGGIDVVGADLAFQPLRAGGVSFMAGLVRIDPTGNLDVTGNARFARDVEVKGTLSAHVLSPVDAANLIVKLDEREDSALVVSNASGAGNLTIHGNGNVASEGDGRFRGLLSKSLSIIKGTQADASPVQTVASSSAGTAVIVPGQTQRTVITPFVREGSLVYITPTSDTQGTVPYVSRQTSDDQGREIDGSFTIQISQSVSKPIKINWWIVN